MLISILSFVLLSFGYSLFEKVSDKNGYIQFLSAHIKQQKLSVFFWWVLVILNSTTTIFNSIGILQSISKINILPFETIFAFNSFFILILLFGQRLAKDFQGAANLAIYFLVNLFGWYLVSQ